MEPTTLLLLIGAVAFLYAALSTQIHRLERTLLMALSAAEQSLIAAFNAETNRIAALIEALPVPEDDTEFNAALDAVVQQLRAVGANPTTPIPAPPPVE